MEGEGKKTESKNSSNLRALGRRVVIQTQDQPTISFSLAVGQRREGCVSVDKSEESQRLTGQTPCQAANNVTGKNRANVNK